MTDKIPDDVMEEAVKLALSIWNDRSICEDTDQDTFLALTVPTISQALHRQRAVSVKLPDCDICKKSQTQLGALHFSKPDAQGYCKKTHICVACDI